MSAESFVETLELHRTPGLLEREPIGEDLRALRRARGLSLADAAARAELSKAALSQWESWARVPSGPALERLLNAYKVDHRTFARLLTSADPQYAQFALAQKPLGPGVDVAQMLRALRSRSGLTQSELAKALCVSQPSIAKWDSGDSIPSGEMLEAALCALGASESERAALLTAQHRPWAPGDAREQLEAVAPLPFVLREFALINCQREFWHRASRSAEGDFGLCASTYCRGWWNLTAGRYSEAVRHLKQSLRLAKAIGDVDIAARSAVRIGYASLRYRDDLCPSAVAASLEKWVHEPLSPYVRGEFLIYLVDILFWARQPILGERYSLEAVELLKDYQSSLIDPPYYGVQGAQAYLVNSYTHQGRPEKAMEVLEAMPEFQAHGYRSQWTVIPYLFALANLGEDPPDDGLAVLKEVSEGMQDKPDDIYIYKRHSAEIRIYHRTGFWDP